MDKKHTRKSLAPFYIGFVLLFSIGLTFLVLSIVMPPKTEEDTLSTTINSTELENKIEQGGADQTPKQNEDSSKTDSSTLDISLSKNEVVNGTYQIRVTIFEVLTETGTCKLEMESSSGDYVRREAKTINAGPETTSCDGFDIKAEGISSGTYNFTLTVTAGDRKGSVTGNIKI